MATDHSEGVPSSSIIEMFPGAQLLKWEPFLPPLRGNAKKALKYIVELDGQFFPPHFTEVMEGIGIEVTRINKGNFNARVCRDPMFQAHLEEAGWTWDRTEVSFRRS
jgi:hypothetical protein